MNKYLIANWKSNMKYEEINNYFHELNNNNFENINVLFAVPTIFLIESKKNSKNRIIAQDVEFFDYGAHTGRTSYMHLIDNKIDGSIVGHSEQRCFNDNTNEIINKKVLSLLSNDLLTILCIGEPKEIKDNNKTIEYIFNQLSECLKDVDTKKYKNKLIIAYEPIWSIGSGQIPTNEYIYNIIKNIKEKYDLDVIYGGSVNEKNIAELKKIENLNGFLVGNASLNPNIFLELIKIYNK